MEFPLPFCSSSEEGCNKACCHRGFMEAVLWHKPGTADITIPTLYHRIIRQHRLKGTSDITYRIPQSTSALQPTGKLRQKGIQPHSHGPHTELQAESREQNLPSGPDDARDALPNVPNSSEVFWGWRGGKGGGCRRPGLSFGVAMAARSSLQTWLYQQSSDGSACDRLKPRG